MTAEVAILNKLAVSLAADSAITTGFPGQETIFNGANKIFTLSKYAPVGVMIYGHVEHCSVPWEVIIKEYRRQLGRQKFDTVAQYAADFQEYIAQDRLITPLSQQATVFGACISAYITAENYLNRNQLRATVENFAKAFSYMDGITGSYSTLSEFAGVSKAKFLKHYGRVIDASFEDRPELPIHVPRANRAKFKELVMTSLISNMTSGYYTGVVVAGFGEKELFPSLVEIKVDGALFDKCRIIGGSNIDIDRGGETVFMKAFAQEDVVNSFLNGVDDDYKSHSAKMLAAFMGEFLEDMLRQHTNYDDSEKNVIRRLVRDNLLSSVDEFQKKLDDFSQERYFTPVRDVLRNAPKDEMAHVAEALVSLTSLKRKVSGERETVGGPVDVAVISKGDGFVWIKRKHYFSPDLNHHFTRNYFASHGEEHGEKETQSFGNRRGKGINRSTASSPINRASKRSHLKQPHVPRTSN